MAPDALDTGFAIRLGGTTILSHAAGAPCIAVGRGHAHVAARRGHFDVSQSDVERIALTHAEADGDCIRLAEHAGGPWLLELTVSITGDDAVIMPRALDPTLNRLWLRVPAEADEHVWSSFATLTNRRVVIRQSKVEKVIGARAMGSQAAI